VLVWLMLITGHPMGWLLILSRRLATGYFVAYALRQEKNFVAVCMSLCALLHRLILSAYRRLVLVDWYRNQTFADGCLLSIDGAVPKLSHCGSYDRGEPW
jgi:hypothetical protein